MMFLDTGATYTLFMRAFLREQGVDPERLPVVNEVPRIYRVRGCELSGCIYDLPITLLGDDGREHTLSVHAFVDDGSIEPPRLSGMLPVLAFAGGLERLPFWALDVEQELFLFEPA